MRVYAYEFSLLFYICNNVVNGNFCCSSCCSRYCNDRNRRILGCCSSFQASYICKFRICNDDTDCLGSIHGRSSTDCYDIICTCCLECLDSMLYIFDGRIWLDIRIQLIFQSCIFQYLCHFAGHIELDQVRIGTNQCFLQSSYLYFCRNLLNCSCSVK